ncbi:response regulator [Natronobacterium texcoconense]|uniref:Response regulator receiver domain-containing protein n=1 Tax=Natronobacterium texcoconense TaxID=1095778 RepID=A0A1H1BD27_NATTX|nr:response regulator [Natronobacterium texcoconense]SDQ49771.1 Response regulator receiver domain-containing protein [Natronobacterium texcoconense]
MTDHSPDEPIDVLLVEDNPGDVRLTQEAFRTTDAEIRFHTATDGNEALEYLEHCGVDGSETTPDVILLDLNLPRVDGFTILETINNDLEYPPPPVLVLSSSRDESDVARSYERAANAYLTKPNSPDEFSSMAKAIERFWIDSVQHPPMPA